MNSTVAMYETVLRAPTGCRNGAGAVVRGCVTELLGAAAGAQASDLVAHPCLRSLCRRTRRGGGGSRPGAASTNGTGAVPAAGIASGTGAGRAAAGSRPPSAASCARGAGGRRRRLWQYAVLEPNDAPGSAAATANDASRLALRWTLRVPESGARRPPLGRSAGTRRRCDFRPRAPPTTGRNSLRCGDVGAVASNLPHCGLLRLPPRTERGNGIHCVAVYIDSGSSVKFVLPFGVLARARVVLASQPCRASQRFGISWLSRCSASCPSMRSRLVACSFLQAHVGLVAQGKAGVFCPMVGRLCCMGHRPPSGTAIRPGCPRASGVAKRQPFERVL